MFTNLTLCSITGHRVPFQWPWNRNGQYQQSDSSQWGPQPWVWVQGSGNEVPPPTHPHYQYPPYPPPEAPVPEPTVPMQSLNVNRECPICKILFPPSETIEKINEHVNNHLDIDSCQ